MKKDYDSTRIYRNTQKKGASQTYDTPSYIYIYIEQLVLLQNKRLIIEDVAHEESQQNIFFIEYQLIKYNKECNC